MITSRTNTKIKFVRRLQIDRRFRNRHSLYVIEGTRWLQEFVEKSMTPRQLFYTEDWALDHHNKEIIEQLGGEKHLVSEQVMETMSATESAPGALAVVDFKSHPLPKSPTFILILDGISDPGNMGTLLRTAHAANVEAVLLAPTCVDVFNPKVVRSSMGALLSLPIASLDWNDIHVVVKDMIIRLATADGSLSYTMVDWQKPAALVIGSEAHGTSGEAAKLAGEKVFIPISKNVESLNAAVAGAIIMFEVVRQRTAQ